MSKLINDYLQPSCSKTLTVLFSRLNQLKQWNDHFLKRLSIDDPLRKHCQVVNLLGDVLIVVADNPHWGTRFRYNVPEWLAHMQLCPGLANIKGIHCKVHPGHHKVPARPFAPPEKLSEKSSAALREMAQKITDVKLRSILEKLAGRTS